MHSLEYCMINTIYLFDVILQVIASLISREKHNINGIYNKYIAEKQYNTRVVYMLIDINSIPGRLISTMPNWLYIFCTPLTALVFTWSFRLYIICRYLYLKLGIAYGHFYFFLLLTSLH